jgi:hypothetical protein
MKLMTSVDIYRCFATINPYFARTSISINASSSSKFLLSSHPRAHGGIIIREAWYMVLVRMNKLLHKHLLPYLDCRVVVKLSIQQSLLPENLDKEISWHQSPLKAQSYSRTMLAFAQCKVTPDLHPLLRNP